MNSEQNKFKDVFKYFKRKNPPPDMSSLYKNDLKWERVTAAQSPVQCDQKEMEQEFHLQPSDVWEIHHSSSRKGLYLIRGALSLADKKYWVKKCLDEYCLYPHRTNIGLIREQRDLINLRWSTMGYHHNWDSKVYSDDEYSEMPLEVCLMSRYLCNSIGISCYQSQAVIVNYYNKTSSLSPHQDQSEIDVNNPIISLSLGMSAVFLIGDDDLRGRPDPILLHSGDIIILSGEVRLGYHAVPLILYPTSLSSHKPASPSSHIPASPSSHKPASPSSHQTASPSSHKPASLSSPESSWCEMEMECDRDEEWGGYWHYLSSHRINMNIRQVLPAGLHSLTSVNTN